MFGDSRRPVKFHIPLAVYPVPKEVPHHSKFIVEMKKLFGMKIDSLKLLNIVSTFQPRTFTSN